MFRGFVGRPYVLRLFQDPLKVCVSCISWRFLFAMIGTESGAILFTEFGSDGYCKGEGRADGDADEAGCGGRVEEV